MFCMRDPTRGGLSKMIAIVDPLVTDDLVLLCDVIAWAGKRGESL